MIEWIQIGSRRDRIGAPCLQIWHEVDHDRRPVGGMAPARGNPACLNRASGRFYNGGAM